MPMITDQELSNLLEAAGAAGASGTGAVEIGAAVKALAQKVTELEKRPALQAIPVPPNHELVRYGYFPIAQNVTKGTTVTITVRSTRAIRADRWTVPAAIAANFTIGAILVGAEPLFCSSAQMHPAQLSELAQHFDPSNPVTINEGQDVSVTVTNTDAANDHIFYICVEGPQLKRL